jgi:hypothetical protein
MAEPLLSWERMGVGGLRKSNLRNCEFHLTIGRYPDLLTGFSASSLAQSFPSPHLSWWPQWLFRNFKSYYITFLFLNHKWPCYTEWKFFSTVVYRALERLTPGHLSNFISHHFSPCYCASAACIGLLPVL